MPGFPQPSAGDTGRVSDTQRGPSSSTRSVPLMEGVTVLMTCHNRREQTLACLARVFRQTFSTSVDLRVILVDDGSTDGTGQSVQEKFPQVTVLHGNGALFWTGGMRMAFAEALRQPLEYALWLNDDTNLHPWAVDLLLATLHDVQSRGYAEAIIVGPTQNIETGRISYGGWKRIRRPTLLPPKWIKVEPSDHPVECDSMNGNCVLIPGSVVRLVGNLDPRFTHAMGDLDYGFRARAKGCRLWMTPGFVGTCNANADKGTWKDKALPVLVRWRQLVSPKGLPPKEWLLFMRRHGGWLWPLLWVNPYLKFWLRAAYERSERTSGG